MSRMFAKAWFSTVFAMSLVGCHSDLNRQFEETGAELEGRECSEGTWDYDRDPDTPCAPHRDCLAGSYVAAPGGPLDDRFCAICPPGTFSADTNSPMCQPWQQCAPGTMIDTPGHPEYDTACKNCPSGTFSANVNSSDCVPWTDCQPQQFVSSSGTAARNRTCENCEGESMSSALNSAACVHDDECPQGTVMTGEICTPCAPGSECSGAVAPQLECGADAWDNDMDPATPCIEKTVCAPGQFVKFAGSDTADRICETCAHGEFSTDVGASSCTPWTSCAAPSLFASSSGSTTTDRICGECTPPAETFADNQTRCTGTSYQMIDGQVVIQSENYTSTGSGGAARSWSALGILQASGGICMEVTAPGNSEVNWLNNFTKTAPRLVYTINFPETGSYRVHIRGNSGIGGVVADSCWGGIDDKPLSEVFDFASEADVWSWDSQNLYATAGVHNFIVWPREDGVRVDKIVINNTGVVPSGEGPEETPRAL